jgi:hypothetical protein
MGTLDSFFQQAQDVFQLGQNLTADGAGLIVKGTLAVFSFGGWSDALASQLVFLPFIGRPELYSPGDLVGSTPPSFSGWIGNQNNWGEGSYATILFARTLRYDRFIEVPDKYQLVIAGPNLGTTVNRYVSDSDFKLLGEYEIETTQTNPVVAADVSVRLTITLPGILFPIPHKKP